MTSATPAPARSRPAMIAGFSLLLMAVLAAAANFGVIEPNRAELATFAATNPQLFGLAILALITVVILDVTVAWALHQLFMPQDQALSLLTAWFRLAYAAVFLVAISSLTPLPQLAGTELAALPLAGFDALWNTGLLLFGVHLLLLATLLIRSAFAPAWLGALVGIAGAGYVLDSALPLLAPATISSIGSFTFVGEVVLFIWLLVRARNLSD